MLFGNKEIVAKLLAIDDTVEGVREGFLGVLHQLIIVDCQKLIVQHKQYRLFLLFGHLTLLLFGRNSDFNSQVYLFVEGVLIDARARLPDFEDLPVDFLQLFYGLMCVDFHLSLEYE